MPRPRHDGWTPPKRQAFLDHLAQNGNVAAAARAVGMSASSAYRLRTRPDGADFAQLWDITLEMTHDELYTHLVTQALTPQVREIVRRGEVVGRVHRENPKLLTALLRQFERTRTRTRKALGG